MEFTLPGPRERESLLRLNFAQCFQAPIPAAKGADPGAPPVYPGTRSAGQGDAGRPPRIRARGRDQGPPAPEQVIPEPTRGVGSAGGAASESARGGGGDGASEEPGGAATAGGEPPLDEVAVRHMGGAWKRVLQQLGLLQGAPCAEVAPSVTTVVLNRCAREMQGWSGREIAKFMVGVQSAAYGSQQCRVDAELLQQVLEEKLREHRRRVEVYEGRISFA